MKRKLWGEFKEREDEEELTKKLELDRQIIFEKRSELKILHSSVYFLEPKENRIQLTHKNPAVNQIVGLKQKQELIEELIETSQNDIYTFQQILPSLNSTLEAFPSRIVTPKVNDKLNCFISTVRSDFTTGKSKNVQKVNKKCVDMALRKSVCGLLRITDFTEITEPALQLLTDSVDFFYKSLMESIVNVLTFDDRETETDIDIMTFEKGYFNLTSESSTVFLNYFRNEIYGRHHQTATEFTEKVSELKSIVDSHHNLLINEIQHSDFSTNSQFYIKEEVKQEYDEYDDET